MKLPLTRLSTKKNDRSDNVGMTFPSSRLTIAILIEIVQEIFSQDS